MMYRKILFLFTLIFLIDKNRILAQELTSHNVLNARLEIRLEDHDNNTSITDIIVLEGEARFFRFVLSGNFSNEAKIINIKVRFRIFGLKYAF